MSIANIDISIIQNPLDGDKVAYRINRDGQPLIYSNNENKVEKTFRDYNTLEDLDRNVIYNSDGTFNEVFGQFNNTVRAVKYITRPQGDRIVWVGDFTIWRQFGINYPAHNWLVTDETGMPIYFGRDTPFAGGAYSNPRIEAIEYVPSEDTVILGGYWEDWNIYSQTTNQFVDSTKLPCIVGLKLSGITGGVVEDVDFSNQLTATPIREGGINELYFTNNIIYLGGNFEKNTINPSSGNVNTIFAITAIRTNTPTFKYTWNYNFDANINIFNNNGLPEVNAIRPYTSGRLLIGGSFTGIGVGLGGVNVLNVNNIASITLNGTQRQRIGCQVNDKVTAIDSHSGTYYVVGDFTQFTLQNVTIGATQPTKGIIKLNATGTPQITFNSNINQQFPNDFIPLDVKINRRFFNDNDIWIAGDGSSTPDSTNLVIINNNGQVKDYIMVDNTVRGLDTNGLFNDKVYIGGEFVNILQANNPTFDNNTIEIGTTPQQTADNLLANLSVNNTDVGITYQQISTVVRTVYDSGDFSFLTITDIVDFLPRYEVTFNISQLELNLKDFVNFAYKRSDYIIKSADGNVNQWNNVDFDYRLYSGDINDFSITPTQTINKVRLNENQLSQYLNLTPLNRLEEFDINQFKLDEVTPSNIYNVQPARIGKWLYTDIQNNLNGTPTEDLFDVAYITRGWRNDRESDFPKDSILIEGRKRDIIKGGVVKLPFVVDKIGQVRRFNNGFTDGTSIISNTNNSDSYVSYIQSRRSDTISLSFELVERGGSDFTTVTYNYIEPNCNYDLVEVIFINRYGFVETTYMNGRISTDLRTKKQTYNRSIRDINGNLTLTTHSNVTFNKNGTEELICNTGLVKEYNNPMYEDLIMTDRVWVVIDNQIIPATIEDTNFKPQTRLVEKTINYEFRFKLDNTKNKNLI